ncbi:MAG: hypothetical protein ACOYEW_02110 [Anaerolineae bacterium]|jgi:hypothetical protein
MLSTSSFLRALIVAALIACLGASAAHASEPGTADAPPGEEPLEALMAAPALLSPPDGAHTTGNPNDPDSSRLLYPPLGIPTFTWDDVDASKYELEIATTPAFGASVVLRRSNLQYTSYTPTGFDETGAGLGLTEDAQHNFIDQATFYWRVRAWDDEQKQWGSFSPARTFVRHWGYVPQLLGPAHLSTQSGTPAFSWEPVPGASFYQIQVDTSSAFGSPYISAATDVPFFTPTNSLQNDDDIFWRVRAFHRPNKGSFTGGRGGPWSEVRQFKLAWSSKSAEWDTRPLQLTPPNNANYMNRPLFCWRPVPGAKSYSIDVATNPGFVADSFVVKEAKTEGTCYTFNRDSTYKLAPDTTYYWRVTALDARGYPGQRTDEGTASAPFQFRTAPDEPPTVPSLFYPPYYYPPVLPQNFEDRTVAVPTFVWDHVEGATSYQLMVDDDPAMAEPHLAVIDTENASYTFTDPSAYGLQDGQVYYWKVRSNLSPPFSELNTRWAMRLDTRLLPVSDSVKLIQPTYRAHPWTGGFRYGQESLTYYPVFSWTAVAPAGTAEYEIEIAWDEGFVHRVHVGRTKCTEYTPVERPEPGTYFWRVRQVSPQLGPWSDPGRFIISRNFSFAIRPTFADPGLWMVAVSPSYSPPDEIGDSGLYDLHRLHLVNDSDAWCFAVLLPLPDTRLGFYLDTDHFDHSGATTPPPGRPGPQTPVAHLPEYAIYVDGPTGASEVLRWTGTSWESLGTLANILGHVIYYGVGVVEVKVPVTAIGMPGSLSVNVFSYDATGVQDVFPDQPGDAQMAAFLTEGTAPTPLYPANAPSDPSLAVVERNTPVLIWRHHDSLAPRGVQATLFFQTFQDDTFSNLYESENGKAPNFTSSAAWFWDANPYWAPQVHYSDNDSYNWRVSRAGFGPSAPHRFSKAGYVPTDLTVEPLVSDIGDGVAYTDRTPAFHWEPAQSAVKYRWELYEGSVRKASQDVMMPFYAPTDALKDGTYTWKVWAIDARGRLTEEAAQGAFSKVSPPVRGLRVYLTASALELVWHPVENAAYYKVLIASDDQFSRSLQSYTTSNSVFSPEAVPKAARTGSFFVRVITCDNEGNEGPYVDLYFQSPQQYLPLVLTED